MRDCLEAFGNNRLDVGDGWMAGCIVDVGRENSDVWGDEYYKLTKIGEIAMHIAWMKQHHQTVMMMTGVSYSS